MIITQTPLRISFLGGNTDFRQFFQKRGGAVLTTAINKYIYCIVTKRFDDKIYINWSKKEIVDSVDQIEHELVREAMRKVGITGGIEVSFLADIPSEGSGLGSSGSVLVGALNALYHFVGHSPGAEQLAREAVEIEVDVLKKPVGIQDQYIAAYGGLRFLEFQKNSAVKVSTIGVDDNLIDDLDNYIMLFFTGRVRRSASILTGLQASLPTAEKTLLKTKQLAVAGRRALLAGRIPALANLMHRYWLLKKSLAPGISDGEIDGLYQKALAAGAIGGKIAGAGGGGFLVLMVPSEKRPHVRRALKNLREVPVRLEPDGSKVILDIRQY